MSNEKKSATLGMPHGTAAHRLRKNILFHLLKKHNENVCFKCGEQIAAVDDLSIEHKKPWEGVSADLFWDLNNVAFSHVKCNVPHHRFVPNGADYRKIGPQGTAWCTGCQTFHSEASFSKDAAHWNGLRSLCREQMKEYKKRYFEKQSTVGLAATTPLS
jgi:hypothetical protein